jgi:hypothetical protein
MAARQTLDTPIISAGTSRTASIHDVYTTDQVAAEPAVYVHVDENGLDQDWLESQPAAVSGKVFHNSIVSLAKSTRYGTGRTRHPQG